MNRCVDAASNKPNFILLMSDDQGFVDVGYNTNNDLGTRVLQDAHP